MTERPLCGAEGSPSSPTTLPVNDSGAKERESGLSFRTERAWEGAGGRGRGGVLKNEPDNEAARNKQTNSQAFRISHSGLALRQTGHEAISHLGKRSGQGRFFMHPMPKLDETSRARARTSVLHKKRCTQKSSKSAEDDDRALVKAREQGQGQVGDISVS